METAIISKSLEASLINSAPFAAALLISLLVITKWLMAKLDKREARLDDMTDRFTGIAEKFNETTNHKTSELTNAIIRLADKIEGFIEGQR